MTLATVLFPTQGLVPWVVMFPFWAIVAVLGTDDDWYPIAKLLDTFNPWSIYTEYHKLTPADAAVSQTGFPKYTVSALRLMSVKRAGGSKFLVMSSLTVRLVADVIVGCFVASKLLVFVLVYVVDWLALNASWLSTYVPDAFGINKLSTLNCGVYVGSCYWSGYCDSSWC